MLMIPVPGATHQLEARLQRIPSSRELAVIAPPHPVYGGSIGNPVVRAVERAFAASELSTLAFNFRGTGESGGEPSGEQTDALVDYRAAARSVPDLTLGWFAGYSFGSIAALATARELNVGRVLMVAPPLGMLERALLAGYGGQLAVVVGDQDEYAPVEAVREIFATREHTSLSVIEGVEHFFLGSSVQRLSSALAALLPQVKS